MSATNDDTQTTDRLPLPPKHPLDGLLEPGAEKYDTLTSIAISLKRIADHLVPADPAMPPLVWLADAIREARS